MNSDNSTDTVFDLSLLNAFRERVEEGLKELQLEKEPEELYQPISYTFSLGGKRMRPVLVLLGNNLFNGDIEKALPAALAIEIFHNFTLLHDDIMDNAPLRRNKPTVHSRWNKNIALLSGDVMLVMAYQLLNKCETDKLKEVLDIFNDTAVKVCEGQQLDMNYEQQEMISINDYLGMIRLKTAVLLGGSLKIGAVLAGASERDAKYIYEFGENIGLAFQLQDDILDAFGDPQKFGKQLGGDILANKKTFLLLKAMEKAGEAEKERLQNLLRSEAKENKIKEVLSLYEILGVKQEARAEMQSHYDSAMQALSKISVGEEKKQVIADFARQLMIREI